MEGSENMSETMAKRNSAERKTRPAMSPEARELQLVSMSMDEAEYLIRNHKASSQVITHFLKLGSTLAELEKEKLIAENQVLKAKAELIKSTKASEELYTKALEAMRNYSGKGDND